MSCGEWISLSTIIPFLVTHCTHCQAWSVGVSLGAYISGGISGGHINPAVTVALAAFRGFVSFTAMNMVAMSLTTLLPPSLPYARSSHGRKYLATL